MLHHSIGSQESIERYCDIIGILFIRNDHGLVEFILYNWYSDEYQLYILLRDQVLGMNCPHRYALQYV